MESTQKTPEASEVIAKKVSRREVFKYAGLFMGSAALGGGLMKPSSALALQSAGDSSVSNPRKYINSTLPKIDIFCHILPEKYVSAFKKKTDAFAKSNELENAAVTDIDMRLRIMDRYPDVFQVLTVSLPPVESLVSPKDAVELAQIANDELAELVMKYPDKFVGAAACLPLNDMDATLKEVDRAITQLGLKGVQITTTVNGENLNSEKFWPLYEKMAEYDLPLWIHPCSTETQHDPLLGWLYQTASAMRFLDGSGVFYEFPDIKFITHHGGSFIPYAEGRIKWMFANGPKIGPTIKEPLEHFRKFYNDTAVYGGTSALELAHGFFGADHILFGTDAPLGPEFGLTSETLRSVERMAVSDTDKTKIFLENAVKLLKLAI